MALTDTQKAEVRFYCGYSVLDNASAISRAIDGLDANAAAATLVLTELETCKRIDAQLREVGVLSKAIRDGAIELRAHYTLGVLQAQGRQAAMRIARFLGIALGGDVFSGSAGPGPQGEPSSGGTLGGGAACC